MGFSHVLSLFTIALVCAMAVTVVSAETANQTCRPISFNLQKPNGNCDKRNLSFGFKTLTCGTVRVSWMHRPPWVAKPNQEGTRPSGIFVDLLQSSLTACCRLKGSDPPTITYDAQPAKNIQALYRKVYKRQSDIIFPISSDLLHEIPQLETFSIITSLGDALVINKSFRNQQDQDQAWRSLVQIAPILLLSILLAAIAGICIWALDTKWNPQDFPRPFPQGAGEGFWWAFVTMTTVGYGDRTPKSLLGRIFGIFWIIASLAICSIMTASITAVLTSMSVDKDHIDIMDKTVAVLNDSGSIRNAVQNDANPKHFDDFDSMYAALNEGQVDGILMEMYEAAYKVRDKGDHNLKVAKMYQRVNKIGFLLSNSEPLPSSVQSCVRMIYKWREYDVFMTVNKFFQRVKKKKSLRRSKEHEVLSLITFGSPVLLVFFGIFIFLSLCGVIDHVFHRARRQTKMKNNLDLKKPLKTESHVLVSKTESIK